MSASQFGNMRAPRVKAPLLLLLLLTTLLTGTVFCQEEDADPGDAPEEPSGTEDPESETGDTVTSAVSDTPSEPEPTNQEYIEDIPEDYGSGSISDSDSSEEPTGSPELDPIIIIIPAALVVGIIGIIVGGIFINRRWNKQKRNPELSKEDPCLDGSSTEKVPMPMFEEDVPSVLELEMEELDQWMKKDGEVAEDSKHV